MNRQLRIGILLVILLLVAVTTWRDRVHSRQWRVPLFVAIHPIAADDSERTRAYVAGLNAASFAAIDAFFARQARHFNVALEKPLQTRFKSPLSEMPPQRAGDAGIFKTILWSLQLRLWAWRMTRHATEPEDIRIFVLYHDPLLSPAVPHSLGLEKGLIGVVYAFATTTMEGGNDVVIAHELLHTLGASDKYAAEDNSPRFPDGYGDPRQVPLYPQATAELMAGRRMLSAARWEQPDSLDEVVIGPASASEIRWTSGAP